MEIMRRAQEQKPGPDGIRRTRWAVIRNTYGELKDTTLKTWLDWFPEDVFGHFNRSDMVHIIRVNDVHMEVLFRALDRPKDVAKLLSLELTGAWINEARELPKGIIDALDDRCGRYPAVRHGGCTWAGLMMDTNPPDDDHWWYRLSEGLDLKTGKYAGPYEGWDFFRQPGGMIESGGKFVANPAAENLANLADNFYLERASGKSKDHIRVYYCARYGFVQEGKPVYPEYADEVHAWKEPIEPLPGEVLWVGIDFGLTPAALFAQQTPSGRWLWIDELVTEDMGTSRFAELLGPKLRGEYAGYDIQLFGDPAGVERAQTDERTPYQILAKYGINALAAPTNDWTIRRDCVANPMMRMIDGLPGFLISPKCVVARKALAGGYALKRIQVHGEERYHDRPFKTRYSHVIDAGQYAMLGAGEGAKVVGYEDDEDDEEWPYEQMGRSPVTGY